MTFHSAVANRDLSAVRCPVEWFADGAISVSHGN